MLRTPRSTWKRPGDAAREVNGSTPSEAHWCVVECSSLDGYGVLVSTPGALFVENTVRGRGAPSLSATGFGPNSSKVTEPLRRLS